MQEKREMYSEIFFSTVILVLKWRITWQMIVTWKGIKDMNYEMSMCYNYCPTVLETYSIKSLIE